MKKRQNISALFTIAVFYLILESVFGITCPILFLTGISCAGCGMSRAWIALLHFNIHEAFMYHPLFFLPPQKLRCCMCHKCALLLPPLP